MSSMVSSEQDSVPAARAETERAEPWLQVLGSRYFLEWLAEQQLSLAVSTYQTGKLLLVGRRPGGGLAVFERTIPHCMGMWAAPDARSLWLSSRYQLWRFDNALVSG